MNEGVTCVIPGAKNPAQVDDNNKASELPPLSESQMSAVKAIYDRSIRPLVHSRW